MNWYAPLPKMECRIHPLWTDAEDRQLRELAKTETAAAIGRAMGRTRYSILSRAQTIGLSLDRARHYTYAENCLIRARAGLDSAEEIGLQIGRTARAIRKQAAKLGVSLRCYGDRHHSTLHPDSDVEAIRTLSDDGVPVARIRQAYPRVSRAQLNKYIAFAERHHA